MLALDLLRCPRCGSELEVGGEGLACAQAHTFPMLTGEVPDLAGALVAQPETAGQRAMRFEPLVAVYEKAWRPLFTAFIGGGDPDAETAKLVDWLALPPGAAVLDLACGPGNTTRRLAAGLPAGGRIVAADLSDAMLRRAAADTPATIPIGYVKADAHRLPLAKEAFDGAHCAAALYLIDDPGSVVAGIAKLLKPGGRFVGMTIVTPTDGLPFHSRLAESLNKLVTGMKYVSTRELRSYCDAAGLVDFHTERRGGSLLFRATKPAS